MGKKKLSTNWYVHHQDRMEWYESQEAALDAVDLFVSSYENGIWNDKISYLSLGHADGETVDSDLFKRRYSSNALTPSSIGSIFKINIFIKNKEDWIFRYGSDVLRQSFKAGYECNDGYLAERLAFDYPGFMINDRKYPRVDTPSARCLEACSGYKYAHCSSDRENYYITIDDYLGKYQLIKLIDTSIETTALELSIGSIDDKEDWIFEYGSTLLQQSFIAGYTCNDRYLEERVAHEYPGFTINRGKYRKVDSPSERCLFACFGYENSYCSSNNSDYYITIDGFLGKYQLIKSIDPPTQILDITSAVGSANNWFGLKMIKLESSKSLIKSAVVTEISLTQLISVCAITSTLMYLTIEYLPGVFQAIVSNI
ncbi:MAG: hypothetical protein HC778_08450 [Chamaesiphon sp. CSU_1_12]|nr:hypothetical protein [Chamaesiphon sp. CSU_1_12]